MMQNVFTKTLERITKETGLVGGVAIVFKNGEITFAAPYGYEDRENDIPMTLNASFDIASCSKAWTVMLAAQAVDEGLIGWDEPVQHAMKDFDMLDHYAGAHLSIRDMASHRSGLPCHDFMRNKVGGSRRNLMLKCAILTRARASGKRINTITICTLCWAILWRCCAVAKSGKAR